MGDLQTDTTSKAIAKYSLCKDERLCRKKIIEAVFKEGQSIKTQSLVLVFHYTQLPCTYPAQVMFTASKKLYKKAHDRNRIKRLLREAYRKQKHIVYNSLKDQDKQVALLFIFTGKQLPNYPYVHGKVLEVLKKFTASKTQRNANRNIE